MFKNVYVLFNSYVICMVSVLLLIYLLVYDENWFLILIFEDYDEINFLLMNVEDFIFIMFR